MKARHHAEVRFLPIDEQHTRVHVAGDEADVDRAAGDLRGSGLSGAAGGTFGGGTGGTPGAGGRHPGTT